jgi:hypothetical protein
VVVAVVLMCFSGPVAADIGRGTAPFCDGKCLLVEVDIERST